MHQIKTELAEFSAAHRLIKGYQGKCRHLHGHNYRIFVTFSAAQLDEFDFVVDFGDVKELCNQWVQDNWDHSVIISSDDEELLQFARAHQQHHYVIPNGLNTTVEVLAKTLFTLMAPLVKERISEKNPTISLTEVEIWETKHSCARYAV
ncbi:MAG: 6-carboxytetrahydropterin synthase [Coxiellaceae bacterium]|nr:6-carboxytetrahydropterin synthase [Coxiellaceae bacterium]